MTLAYRRACGESFCGVLTSRADRSASSIKGFGSYEQFYTKMASKEQAISRLSVGRTARFENLQTKAEYIFEKVQRFAKITNWSHLISTCAGRAASTNNDVNFSICASIAVQSSNENRLPVLNVAVPQVTTTISCEFQRYDCGFQLMTLATRLHQVRGPPVDGSIGVVEEQHHKNTSSTLSSFVCSTVYPAPSNYDEGCFYFLRATV